MIFVKIIESRSNIFKNNPFDVGFIDEIFSDQLQLDKKQFLKFQSELRFGK